MTKNKTLHNIKSKKQKWNNQYPFHLMMLPGTILLLVFAYMPMIGIIMAFQKFNPFQSIWGSPMVGLDNFRYIFSMPNFWNVVRNTVYISGLKIILCFIIPVVIALLLNELKGRFLKSSIQTAIYLPHFLSWVILAGVLMDTLSPESGLLNSIITSLGGKSIYFLGNEKVFPLTLVFSELWKEFGYGTVVYLAALAGIDPTLYEAAEIDGASRFKQTLYVTLPGLVPIMALMFTLSLGGILNAGFDQVLNLYSVQVYSTGDILDTLIYRVGLKQFNYSLATAMGLVKSVVSVIFTVGGYWLAKKYAGYRVF